MSDNRISRGPKLAKHLRGIALAAIPFAAMTFVSREAHAQAWLRDRTYQEGIGIRVGDVELHPDLVTVAVADAVARRLGSQRDRGHLLNGIHLP